VLHGAKGDCRNTLQVDRNCFSPVQINYVATGVAHRLCHIPEITLFQMVTLWCNVLHFAETQEDPLFCVCAKLWALAGRRGWPRYATPINCRPDCEECSEPCDAREFSVQWNGMTWW